jgi:hypothetical protein
VLVIGIIVVGSIAHPSKQPDYKSIPSLTPQTISTPLPSATPTPSPTVTPAPVKSAKPGVAYSVVKEWSYANGKSLVIVLPHPTDASLRQLAAELRRKHLQLGSNQQMHAWVYRTRWAAENRTNIESLTKQQTARYDREYLADYSGPANAQATFEYSLLGLPNTLFGRNGGFKTITY